MQPCVIEINNMHDQRNRQKNFANPKTGGRPSYGYRAPLIYIEPIAKLEAVDTRKKKEPACLETWHSDWALMIP